MSSYSSLCYVIRLSYSLTYTLTLICYTHAQQSLTRSSFETCFFSLDDTYNHPLLLHAMQLARTSVLSSTQKAYTSSCRKWERFYQQFFHCLPSDQFYRTLTQTQFLELLLMFVSYCVFELRCNIHLIPGIMSALRYAYLIKLVNSTPFDDPLLRTVKEGVANMSAPPHRVRTINNLMLATGVALAYFLCLTSSEYVTNTIVLIDDSHQFRSTEVEFMLNDGSLTFIASNKLKHLQFSLLHANNIRRNYGVPIWFSATDTSGQIIPFVQLLFRWSKA